MFPFFPLQFEYCNASSDFFFFLYHLFNLLGNTCTVNAAVCLQLSDWINQVRSLDSNGNKVGWFAITVYVTHFKSKMAFKSYFYVICALPKAADRRDCVKCCVSFFLLVFSFANSNVYLLLFC